VGPHLLPAEVRTLPLLVAAAGAAGYGMLLAGLAARVARGAELRGAARKLFHAGIFSGAVPAQLLLGFWGAVVYGTVIAAMVALAFLLRERTPLRGALARGDQGGEGDRYLLLPLASTALGGMAALSLVGPFAVVGFLVCGWGDAAGELVGRRWGSRRYRSPLTRAHPSYRTAEGSAAVFLVGGLGAVVGLLLLGFGPGPALGGGVACGLLGALAEGASSHGTDNLWMQVVPSLGAWWMLG
jgi:phytol kinase